MLTRTKLLRADLMNNPAYFRERAAQCYRLAKSIVSEEVSEALRALGRDFEADAVRLEALGTGRHYAGMDD